MTSDKRADARTTTLKYVSQLIESADALFRQDTAESLAEATQLYLQARDLLGAKPASGVPSDTEAGYRATVTDRLEKIRKRLRAR